MSDNNSNRKRKGQQQQAVVLKVEATATAEKQEEEEEVAEDESAFNIDATTKTAADERVDFEPVSDRAFAFENEGTITQISVTYKNAVNGVLKWLYQNVGTREDGTAFQIQAWGKGVSDELPMTIMKFFKSMFQKLGQSAINAKSAVAVRQLLLLIFPVVEGFEPGELAFQLKPAPDFLRGQGVSFCLVLSPYCEIAAVQEGAFQKSLPLSPKALPRSILFVEDHFHVRGRTVANPRSWKRIKQEGQPPVNNWSIEDYIAPATLEELTPKKIARKDESNSSSRSGNSATARALFPPMQYGDSSTLSSGEQTPKKTLRPVPHSTSSSSSAMSPLFSVHHVKEEKGNESSGEDDEI